MTGDPDKIPDYVALQVDNPNGTTSDEITVAIIGAGLFGRALGRVMHSSMAARAIFGVRNPKDAELSDLGLPVIAMDAAVDEADVVILAVPATAHASVLEALKDKIQGKPNKIVVDCSNRALSRVRSRAESDRDDSGSGSLCMRLERMLRGHGFEGHVVKAFNTNSAYEMAEASAHTRRVVHLSGDNIAAKGRVERLANRMGYTCTDLGGLAASLSQEDMPHRFFQGWKRVAAVTFVVTLWWFLYNASVWYIIPPVRKPEAWPFNLLMESSGEACMTLFALTFLPGSLAAILQIVRSRSSSAAVKSPFPAWLSEWLSLRKALGLSAFWLLVIHAICGATAASHLDNSGFLGYLYFALGILGFAFFAILSRCSSAVTAPHLSWSEFRFVFSHVGYLALGLGIAHQTLWAVLISAHFESPAQWPGGLLLPFWLGLILPGLAMLLKMVLVIPGISHYLDRIRGLR